NRSKRSVVVDMRNPEGQEIVAGLITASGDNAGICATNYLDADWLGYEKLRRQRADLIYLHIVGNRDGGIAVDYTVNSAVGLPFVTGNASPDHPVNHVLPVWDLLTGLFASTGLLAAERHRRLTGQGQQIRLPLSDVALSIVGALGFIAEAM